jgi:transcriptional regulator with XRE-family HTH domain
MRSITTVETMQPNDQISKNLRQARERSGLSQAEVAKQLEVSERNYRRWENGETYGHLHRLPDLARILGVRQRDLLGDADVREVLPPREALDAKMDIILEEFKRLRDDLDLPD